MQQAPLGFVVPVTDQKSRRIVASVERHAMSRVELLHAIALLAKMHQILAVFVILKDVIARIFELDDFDKLYEESIPVYQSEWGIHERFVDVMDTIAIPGDFTPFAVPDSVTRLILEAEDEHINNRMSATAAAKRASDRVNEEIDWTLKENPKLLSKYKILCNDQKLIDELRSKGQKVPVSLIQNPFYVKYYREQGWSSDSD